MAAEISVAQLSGNRVNVLKKIIAGVGGKSVKVLEIGSYEGGSALCISETVAELYGEGEVVCVDPWKSYLPKGRSNGPANQMDEELVSGRAFRRFKQNIKLADPRCPIRFIVGTIHDVLHPEFLFDLIFIDGAHDYESVFADLWHGSKVLRLGGVLCGDDLEAQVMDVVPGELQDDLEEYNGRYHPGVTKAVGEFFRRRIWCEEGVWAVRNLGDRWEDFHAVS